MSGSTRNAQNIILTKNTAKNKTTADITLLQGFNTSKSFKVVVVGDFFAPVSPVTSFTSTSESCCSFSYPETIPVV